ncbi:hypothetical protein ABZY02_15980 [Streptomyces sp. NPDC006649]|uniref:hypothetical protein n=1 Tax=Streptomyces sp. NPDC006649 TaxID=3156896 RepID=UPI0033A9A31D
MVRRWVPAVTLAFILGGLWWWAVLRLVLAPGESGPLEGAVAAGGWGLSLLPVHVVALPGGRSAARGRARAPRSAGVLRRRPDVRRSDVRRSVLRRTTRAWRRRRSGAGSDPS